LHCFVENKPVCACTAGFVLPPLVAAVVAAFIDAFLCGNVGLRRFSRLRLFAEEDLH
jgi:hypothetical protein